MQGNGGNYSTNLTIKLYGKTNLDGLVTLNQGRLHLFDSAKVKRIEGTNSASIRVDKDWDGSATVDYFTEYLGTYVSRYNGCSTGDFPGQLMLADGRQLVGENGKLRIVGTSQQPPEAPTAAEPTEKSFWQKVLDFFKRLFSGQPDEEAADTC